MIKKLDSTGFDVRIEMSDDYVRHANIADIIRLISEKINGTNHLGSLESSVTERFKNNSMDLSVSYKCDTGINLDFILTLLVNSTEETLYNRLLSLRFPGLSVEISRKSEYGERYSTVLNLIKISYDTTKLK